MKNTRAEDERLPRNYNIGISTSAYVCFDIDLPHYMGVVTWLYEQTQATIAVFKTAHGYWIVSSKQYTDPDEWLAVYYAALFKFPHLIDSLHAQLSIKYKHTTLRVSKQNSKGAALLLIYPGEQ